MAKKNKSDEFDLDNFDFDDFDEPPRGGKDKKRNPILETAKLVGRSALATIWPKGKRDQVILKGMPKAAQEAYDGYQSVKAATKDVYAHTKDEILKTERMLKQQTRQLTPTMRKYLPDAVTKPISKWSKNNEQQSENYDPRQAMIDRGMSEVFGNGNSGGFANADEQRSAQQDATEDRLRDSVRDMKSDALMQTVIGIAKDVRTTSQLTSGVLLNIHRKQLEIQYRTLFALQDIGKLKQAEFERNTPALEAIVKNTGLPDYAKEEFSEIRWANIKRQAADWMNPLKYAEGFVDQIKNNATKKISQGFGDARGILESLLGMAVEDDFDADDSSSLSSERRGKNARDKATGGITKVLAKKLLGPHVEKAQKRSREWMEQNPNVSKGINKSKFAFGNLSSIANSAVAGEDMGALGNFFKGAHELGLFNPMRREKAFLDDRNGEMMTRSAKFDHRTWLTINEIMPAWLSEINKSIRRGYGEHADMEYDVTSRGFVDRKVIGNRVRKHVANDAERKRMQESIGSTVDYIDKDKTLSQKERQGLSDFIEERASTGKAFDVDALIKDQFALGRHMSGDGQSKLVSILKGHRDRATGGGAEVSNELAARIAKIQSSISRRQGRIDEATGLYGERALRDAGIFNYDHVNDRFDVDRDLSDPYTLFNDLAMGKTRTGRSLTREQEIQRKLANGSATADLLRRRLGGGPQPGEGPLPPRPGGGGLGGGLSGLQLARVLYGEKSTNFVELMEERRQREGSGPQNNDGIIEAIRANSNTSLIESILGHIKHMDEDGVYVMGNLGGGGGGPGDMGPPLPPGPGGGPAGGGGLLRRWGNVLGDTARKGFRGARRGARQGYDRFQRFGSWARSKFGGGSGGGAGGFLSGMFGRVKGTVTNALSGAASFGKAALGARDIYNGKGVCVLKGSYLQNGDYYQTDSDGKSTQLFKLDDIRLGMDITDEEGNVILTSADLAEGGGLTYYNGTRWKKLWDVIGTKAGQGFKSIMEAPGKLLGIARKPFNSVKDWFTQLPDIYVQGDTRPRLYANLMRQGEYLLKRNGRPIYSPADITGAVVDSEGRDVITDDEFINPNFMLVDKHGREVKSPLGRLSSKIRGMAHKARDWLKDNPVSLRGGLERLKGMAKDNPLTRWWGKREKSEGGRGGGIINWSSGKKTNHILIRIYRLLNRRMAGDPEDEAWTEQMEKGAGGSKAVDSVIKNVRGRIRDKRRQLMENRRKRRRNGDSTIGDRFRDNVHDVGTRYEVEKRLAGRDDDVADFYRQRLNRKGKINRKKLGGNIRGTIGDAKDAAGNLIKEGGGKVKTFGQSLMEKMGRMVDLQEIGWFNTMRSSISNAGGSEGLMRTLMGKFSRRNKFGETSEKRDYFQFFRRWGEKRAERKAARNGAGGGKKGVLDSLKALPGVGLLTSLVSGIGSILGTTATVLKFAAKWAVWKPAKLLAKGAWAVGRFAVGTVGRALITPIIAAGSAIVTTVGWPIVLAVGAIAAAGYGAYKLATTTYSKYLDKMRLAQYGFQDYDKLSSDDGAKARYLEESLKGFVSYNNTGEATLRSLTGKDVEELSAGFGIDKENKTEMMSFHAFMLQRFIPLYLRWMSAIRTLEADVSLADLGDPAKVSKKDMTSLYNKLKLQKDSKYLQAVQDPRKADQGFFSKLWDTVTFTSPDLVGADEVMEVQEEVGKQIKFRVDDVTGARHGMSPVQTGAVVESGVADSVKTLAGFDKDRRDHSIKTEGWETGDEQVEIQVDYNSTVNQKDVDALQAVRMKAYGLITLDSANVKGLMLLEKMVLPAIDVKSSSFKGDWTQMIDAMIPGGSRGPKADQLKYWFFQRFLPVFMTYVTGIKRYNSSADPLNLKLSGGYLYEVGLMCSRAYSMKNGIRQPVWDIAINPFGGDANTDGTTVNQELESLQILSKEADLAVRNLLKSTEQNGKKARWKDKDRTRGLFNGSGQIADDPNIQNYAPGSPEALRAQQIQMGGGGSGQTWNGSAAINAAGGLQNYAAQTTGNTLVNLGALGEGNYKDLATKYPKNTLNNVENVKKMIVDVANQLGVPPGLALGMAQAESKFDWTAVNKAGGATGLYQFLKTTWQGNAAGAKGEMQNYGNRFGIPAGTDATDPYANALLGINFIRNNISRAQRDYGGQVPPGVAYLYHFLGAGDGAKFMKAYKANPNAPADSITYSRPTVIGNNLSVFRENDGKGPMRSFAGVMQNLNGRMGTVVANTATSNPSLAGQAFAGQTPTASSSEPSINAGAPAANDSSPAASVQNLPADASQRRDGALAMKGAQAANDASNAAASVTAPNPAGINKANAPSDAAKGATNIATQAVADGMSAEDAAKVAGGYNAQAQAQAAAAKPIRRSDAPANDPTIPDPSVALEQLEVSKDMRQLLTDIRELLKNGAANGGQSPTLAPPGSQQRKQEFPQPTPTLNVSRKAG